MRHPCRQSLHPARKCVVQPLHQRAGMIRLFAAVCLLGAAAAADEGGAYAVVNAPSGSVKASLFSDQYASLPVAQVDGQPVTLREFSSALAQSHGARSDSEKGGARNFVPILDRLIGARLVALEAHEMGIDELPEVKKQVDDFAMLQMRGVLEDEITRDVTADPNQAAMYFREAVREWRLRSVLFAKEEDARAAAAALKSGKSWDEATKKGEQSDSADYVRADKMLPPVAAAVQELFAGQATEAVRVQAGWAIARVEDIRYPENAAERANAEERSLSERRLKALDKWSHALIAQTATVDEKLLARLDFEAKKPGLKALEKDKRVLARVKDGDSIAVADLALALEMKFFHGVDEAIKLKRVNILKEPTFRKMVARAAMMAEARRRHIEATPEFKRRVAEYKESVVFGAFVQRAILPGLEVTEAEGKAWYEKHKADFTYPAIYKLQSLAFGKAKQAQAAYDKLKAGTDFTWLKQNADGQIAEDARALDFTGAAVSSTAMPSALAASLKGSRAGDARLYSGEGQHFVIRVIGVTPEQVQPYLQVRPIIAKKLSGEKVTRAVDDWVAKLRKAHDVKVYLAKIGG